MITFLTKALNAIGFLPKVISYRFVKGLGICLWSGSAHAMLWLKTTRRIIFDSTYYFNSYRDIIEAGQSPYEHYIKVGWLQGCKPNPNVDPIALFLTNNDIEADISNLYRDIIKKNNYIYPNFRFHTDAFPTLARQTHIAENALELQYRPIEIRIRKSLYQLSNYPFSHLERVITNNEAKVMVRLPHAFWDIASSMEALAITLQTDGVQFFSNVAYLRLASRLFASLEKFENHGILQSDVFFSICEQIEFSKLENHSIEIGVSFKGFPTYDNAPFIDPDKHVAHHTNELLFFDDRLQGEPGLIDATLPKRWAITGELKKLPSLVSAKKLIIIGPLHLEELISNWGVAAKHIKIPSNNSHRLRHEILSQIIKEIENEDIEKSPLILTQCGASLAFWLGIELFKTHPSITFLDFGQTLDIWCHSINKDNWMNIFKKQLDAHKYR